MADSTNSGIDVLTIDDGFLVTFPFDAELVRMMQKVKGANWNEGEQAWHIPQNSSEQLDKTVKSMEFELKALTKDHQEILKLAHVSAMALMQERKADKDALPHMRDDWVESKGSQSGVILNVNGRFAAQASGHDAETGMQYVKIHRTAVLNSPVYKGDNVRITYNSNKRADVQDLSKVKNRDQRAKEFDATLYQVIDGVVVGEKDGKYQINFAYNEAMKERVQRIDGANYNDSEKAWEVSVDKKDFVVKAVADIRAEYVVDMAERQKLVDFAGTKVDGPKVWNSNTQDRRHYGKIIETSERYVLQEKGKGEFQLHLKDRIKQELEKDKTYEISFSKGRANAKEIVKDKDKSASLAR